MYYTLSNSYVNSYALDSILKSSSNITERYLCTDPIPPPKYCYTYNVMRQILFSFFVLFGSSLLLTPLATEAASLYIDPARSELYRGDSITIAVRLDTDEAGGECVNAVDGVLTYSSNIEPVDISTGNSILNIWVEPPTINREERTITFAGGIPNGYCGRVIGDPRLSNVLTEIVFRSPGFTIGGSDETTATIAFSDSSTAYLNDGRGTKAPLTTYGASIELNPKAGSTMVNPWQEEIAADDNPPAPFNVQLVEPGLEFNNRYYIVFNTNDKQTGIDHYEVMEEPLTQFGTFQWGRADAPWVEERSPYVLNDQSLNSIIRVKAIDKAGNEYIANLIPDESMRTLSQSQVTTISGGAVGLTLVLVFIFLVWRYLRKRKLTQGQSAHDEVDADFEDGEDESSNIK